jgi:hypothetical protein
VITPVVIACVPWLGAGRQARNPMLIRLDRLLLAPANPPRDRLPNHQLVAEPGGSQAAQDLLQLGLPLRSPPTSSVATDGSREGFVAILPLASFCSRGGGFDWIRCGSSSIRCGYLRCDHPYYKLRHSFILSCYTAPTRNFQAKSLHRRDRKMVQSYYCHA